MFLETLRQEYPALTKGQRIMAEYFVHNYRQAAFMTAAQVAANVSMNEATVVRFAQRLGYQGYPDLQRAIQETVLLELEEPTIPQDATEPADLFARSLAETGARLRNASSLIPREQVTEAVTLLARVSRASIVSAGEGIALGQHMARRLRSLGLCTCTLPADAGEMAQALADVGPDTLVVGCAGARGSVQVATALKLARQAGAQTLALAHSPLTPEAHASQVTLTPPPEQAASATPLVVLMAMGDCLVEAAAMVMPRADAHRRQARLLEQALDQEEERS